MERITMGFLGIEIETKIPSLISGQLFVVQTTFRTFPM